MAGTHHHTEHRTSRRSDRDDRQAGGSPRGDRPSSTGPRRAAASASTSASTSTSTSASASARRSRRTPEETRGLMLAAGVELARRYAEETGDHALATPLAHIRLTDVAKLATEISARRAGTDRAQPITTGAIYPLWASQADYQADLMFHLLGPEEYPEDRDAAARIRDLTEQGVPVGEIWSQVAGRYLERVQRNALTYVYLTFYVLGRHPRVQQAAQHGYADLGTGYASALQALLTREGRRMTAPRTMDDLVTALLAALEGFTLRSRVEPGTEPESESVSVSVSESTSTPASPHLPGVLATTLQALWDAFTEPRASGSR